MFFDKRKWRAFIDKEIIEEKDLIKFNQKIKDKEINFITFKEKGIEVAVNLNRNEIFVNGSLVMEFDGNEKTELLNFRRKNRSMTLNGLTEDKTIGYGVGLRGETKKKFILVRGNNKYELKEE